MQTIALRCQIESVNRNVISGSGNRYVRIEPERTDSGSDYPGLCGFEIVGSDYPQPKTPRRLTGVVGFIGPVAAVSDLRTHLCAIASILVALA